MNLTSLGNVGNLGKINELSKGLQSAGGVKENRNARPLKPYLMSQLS